MFWIWLATQLKRRESRRSWTPLEVGFATLAVFIVIGALGQACDAIGR